MDLIKNTTILLVEDEALIAMSEKTELEKYGYSVRTVTTGEQAVEIIQTSSDIDLILMDINLGPGIDGPQAAEIILKDHDLPIVFLSSHTDPEVVKKTEKITSYGYVVKNSSLTVLDASIKMALKLFESRRESYDTFTHSINGLCVHRAIRDESGRIHDCEYVRVNGAFEKHTGFSSEEIIGFTIRDLFNESDAEGVIRLYDEILAGRANARQEIYFAPTRQWHEISVFSMHGDDFTVVEQNITERKNAEEDLHRANTILKRQQETAPYGILVVSEDDTVVSFNQVFADLWRIPDEIMALQSGEKALEFVLHQLPDPDAFFEEVATLYANRSPEESKEIALTDGRTLVRYSYPMFSDRGPYLGRVWYYQDITERKQAEEEIQRQLTEKESLLREAHHRIKNNMAQVESLLSLQAASADDPGVISALNVAMSRVRSSRILYEKLLVGSRDQEVPMQEYLESIIDSHAAVYNDNAHVSVQKSIVDFPLSSRKAILIGIIVNELLTNVFKYAFDNREKGRVLITLEKTDNRVALTVKDNGIGFNARVTDDNATGFGLTLTQMLAEQLGGTFSIESENGTRSVVNFEA